MRESAKWAHDNTLHAWWVEPGRLLAGEYPGARTPEEATEKLRLLIEEAHIESIVDLTTPADGLAPYREALREAAEKAGRQVDHYAYPIPDMGIIGQEGYDAIVAGIRGEMATDRTVYLHCWGGKGRTSTVVGCLLIDDGLVYEAAIDRIVELRAATRKAIDPCPESASQHRLLRERAGQLTSGSAR